MSLEKKSVLHVLLSVGLIMLSCIACSNSTHEPPLTIAAAASLTNFFKELGEAFTAETQIPVVFSFAATGTLAEQIRNGGPFDIFASADASHLDGLIEEYLIEAPSRLEFANGTLVLIVDPAFKGRITTITDLSDPEISRVAIANPVHAPYGLAAAEALQRAGLVQVREEKIVFGETVHQAAQIVESGNAAAGLVAMSVVPAEGVLVIEIDRDLYSPIIHVLGVRQGSQKSAEAQRFIAFLLSPKGQNLLKKHGLSVPQER